MAQHQNARPTPKIQKNGLTVDTKPRPLSGGFAPVGASYVSGCVILLINGFRLYFSLLILFILEFFF